MDYEAMWGDLKKKIQNDLKYYSDGTMCSIEESIHGEAECRTMLKYMKEIENTYELISLVGQIPEEYIERNKIIHEDIFKEAEDKDIAELFEISTEQAKKEMDDGTIQCIGCDINLEEYIKDFEKLGYTHEESIELAKAAAQPCIINMDEDVDFDSLIELFNSVPEVYPIPAKDIKELLDEHKL